MDVDYLKKCAWGNVFENVTCQSMGEIFGFPGEMTDMYVLSNTSRNLGAGSAFICTLKLKELAKKWHVKGIRRISPGYISMPALAYLLYKEAKDANCYDITVSDLPSWHHQAVTSVDETRLIVSGYTEADGLEIIEAVERPDKEFVLGLQFHPEIDVVREGDEASLKYFTALINEAVDENE